MVGTARQCQRQLSRWAAGNRNSAPAGKPDYREKRNPEGVPMTDKDNFNNTVVDWTENTHDVEVNEGEDIEDVEATIPEELPILPLRGVVVYPQTIIPLTVGQPRSIKLVD